MKKQTKTRIHVLCVWSGMAFAVLTLIGGVLLSGFLPPPSAALTSDQVAIIYRSNPDMIRLGMVMMMAAAALFIPFTSLMARYIIQVEEGVGVITIMQIMGGYSNMILFFYPCMWWLTAGFRPERNVELISLMHDAGWLQFQGAMWPFLFMMISIGIAALVDDHQNPPYPRWLGFFSLLCALMFIPDQALFFFKTGPFAWNGLFPWWIPAFTFFGWIFTMFFVLRSAVLREAQST